VKALVLAGFSSLPENDFPYNAGGCNGEGEMLIPE